MAKSGNLAAYANLQLGSSLDWMGHGAGAKWCVGPKGPRSVDFRRYQ